MITAGNSEVTIQIGAQIDKLVEGVDQAKAQIERIGGSMQNVTAFAVKMGEAIIAGLSINAIKSFAERMGEAGLRAEQMHSQLGISGSALGTLSGLTHLAGVEFDVMARGIERISLNVQRATKDAFDPTNVALKVLGLSTRDFINLPADQYVAKLGEAFSKFEPSLNRTNALMQIGGRGVVQLASAFDQSGASAKEFMERWKAAGGAVDVTKFASTHAELTILEKATKSISVVMFSLFQPAINGGIRALADFTIAIKDSIREGGTFSKVMEFIGGAAKVAATAFAGMLAVIRGLAESVGVLADALQYAFHAISFEEFQKRAKAAGDNFDKIVKDIKTELEQMWAPKITVHPDPKLDASAMNLSSKLEADMAKIRIDAQRAGLTEQLSQTKNYLDAQVSLERLTAAQRIVAVAGATDQIYAQQVALLEKERALYPQRTLEWAKANAEIIKFQQKHSTEMRQLQLQEIVELQQQYMQFLGTIQNAWDSQLDGLLRKTTSWAQAFKNILAQLAIEFIKWAEKKVLVYIAGEAAETAAAASGAVTRGGIAVAEAAGASAVKKASVIESIFQSGAQTFAGVFGFLSPMMGPAAAGPAAASEAVVDAQAGIAAFAVGAWELPSDMVAKVHKGEMIIPAGPADDIRRGGTGGGAGSTVNIYAHDARSVAAWAKDNAGALTSAVASHQRNNPSSRGKF